MDGRLYYRQSSSRCITRLIYSRIKSGYFRIGKDTAGNWPPAQASTGHNYRSILTMTGKRVIVLNGLG